jgi:Flp pilus assembly pilin Flp
MDFLQGCRDEQGASAVEYGLLAGLRAAGVVNTVSLLAQAAVPGSTGSPLRWALKTDTVLTDGTGTIRSSSALTGRKMEKLRNIFHDESGVSVTEYGLVLLLITTIIIAAVGLIGTSISGRLTGYATQFGS